MILNFLTKQINNDLFSHPFNSWHPHLNNTISPSPCVRECIAHTLCRMHKSLFSKSEAFSPHVSHHAPSWLCLLQCRQSQKHQRPPVPVPARTAPSCHNREEGGWGCMNWPRGRGKAIIRSHISLMQGPHCKVCTKILKTKHFTVHNFQHLPCACCVVGQFIKKPAKHYGVFFTQTHSHCTLCCMPL